MALSSKIRVRGHNDRHDDGENTQSRGEDLNDQDFYKESTILRISERAATAANANAHPASQISEAAAHAGPEQGVARRHVENAILRKRYFSLCHVGLFHFRLQDDRDYDAVDRHRLTEDHTDEVLGADARRAHGGTKQGRARDEDTPCSTQH